MSRLAASLLVVALVCLSGAFAGENMRHSLRSDPVVIKPTDPEPKNLQDDERCKQIAAVEAYFGTTDEHLVDVKSPYYAEVLRVTKATKDYVDRFLQSSEYESMRARNVTALFAFDIDETLLSTFKRARVSAYCWDSNVFLEYATRQLDPPLYPTHDLLRHCAQNGIVPVIITSRPVDQASMTLTQFWGMGLRAGHDFWGGAAGWYGPAGMQGGGHEFAEVVAPDGSFESRRGIVLKGPSAPKTAAAYKSSVRAFIEQHGLPGLSVGGAAFVGAIGDQWSDSAGGSTKMQAKLPNPVCTIP